MTSTVGRFAHPSDVVHPYQMDDRLLLDDAMGADMSQLLTSAPEWIRRRVETIELRDATNIHRRISVDFLQPRPRGAQGMPLDGGLERGVSFVPLMWLRKGKALEHLDVVDERGATVPVLSRYENGSLVTRAIAAAASADQLARVYGTSVRDAIWRRASQIVFADPEAGWDLLDRLHWEVGSRSFDRLIRSPSGTLLVAAIDSYSLIVRLTGRRVDRRVIKVRYDAGPQKLLLRAPAGTVAFLTPLMTTGEEASYHAEMEAPEGLDIVEVKGFHNTLDAMQSDLPAKVVDVASKGSRAHLHFGQIPLGSISAVRAEFRLSPSVIQTPGHAILFSSACVALVAANVLLIDETTVAKGDFVAIMTIVPAVLAAYFSRSAEHGFVSTTAKTYRTSLFVFVAATVFVSIPLALTDSVVLQCVSMFALATIAFALDANFRSAVSAPGWVVRIVCTWFWLLTTMGFALTAMLDQRILVVPHQDLSAYVAAATTVALSWCATLLCPVSEDLGND